MANQLPVYKLVDREQRIAARRQARSLPTFLLSLFTRLCKR